MDLNHFSYFVTIVDCGCNLSKAAERIHISQSALSKAVASLEQAQGALLFERKNGRLSGLTEAGACFHDACRDILRRYEAVTLEIRQTARQQVRIGIPPLVLTVVFTGLLSDFKRSHPEVEVEIIEAGAEQLRRQFLAREMDFAVLLAPAHLEGPETALTHCLRKDELVAFVSKEHRYAGRENLSWRDLDGLPLAVLNESFSIHRLLTERFRREQIRPRLSLQSGSWDFLLESALSSDLMTILPMPIRAFVHASEYAILPFADPISWEVLLVEHADGRGYTPAQTLFRDHILRGSR